MTPKQEAWNIVLAGSWNLAIFTPDWVNRVLFSDPELETLIAILPLMPIVYRNKQVSLEVSGGRLVFRPRRLDDACIQAAERMAEVTLSTLQDTPIRGVGVNFGFVEDDLRRDLAELLDFRDDADLTNAGWSIDERRVMRRLLQGEDVLNLTFLLSGQELTAEFNFHTDTTDNVVARRALQGRAVRLRDVSLQILSDHYQLQLVQA
jgi:hypothetical protein